MKRPSDVHATNKPEREPFWGRRGRGSDPQDQQQGEVNSRPVSAVPRPVTPIGAAADSGVTESPAPASTVSDSETMPSLRESRRLVRHATRLRRRFERRERWRLTDRARRARLRALVSIGVVLALVGIVAAVVTSPMLRVRSIVVEGTSRVDASDVVAALQPEVGGLIAFVDREEVASRLSQFSLIKSISVESRLPSTLVVRVTERSPIGVVKSGDSYTVIDAAGVEIETVTSRPSDLPVFSVTAASVDDVGFRSAVEVLQSLPSSIRTQVSHISGKTRDDITVKLSSGLTIVWGDASQSEYKAQVLKAVLKAAPTAKKVDLSAPDVPVVG